MDRPRVLVVDDDKDVGEFLRDALSAWSYDVTRVHDPALEVVMMTGNPMVETAVQALKSGAYDYLIKPLNLDELQHLMHQVLEKRFLSREVHSLRNRLAEHLAVKDLVGSSPGMTRVREIIAKVADSEKEIRPVGSTKTHTVSVRVIAATNKNLEAVVQSGGFRQDLFYRLNVVRIVVPPLRERKSDIPALLTYFLRRFNERFRRDVKGIAPDAMASNDSGTTRSKPLARSASPSARCTVGSRSSVWSKATATSARDRQFCQRAAECPRHPRATSRFQSHRDLWH